MSLLHHARLHGSAYLTDFHAGHGYSSAVLVWDTRGDQPREVRVFRSREGFAFESADPRGDASQALIYEGSEQHSTVTDDSLTDDVVYYYTVFVKDDEGSWQREIRMSVTIDGHVHWRRAGVEGEGESRDRFTQLWTDIDVLSH